MVITAFSVYVNINYEGYNSVVSIPSVIKLSVIFFAIFFASPTFI